MTRYGSWAVIVAVAMLVTAACSGKESKMDRANPVVLFSTTLGDFKIELYPEKAPVTVKNFLGYVNSKFYDGTIFHRVIRDFVIQGGGFTADMKQKDTGSAIKNEAGNGLKNARGTISMARTSVVDSATSQFFISVKDNQQLDHRDETPRGFGYAVFGAVTEGMSVPVTTWEGVMVETVTEGPGVVVAPPQPASGAISSTAAAAKLTNDRYFMPHLRPSCRRMARGVNPEVTLPPFDR